MYLVFRLDLVSLGHNYSRPSSNHIQDHSKSFSRPFSTIQHSSFACDATIHFYLSFATYPSFHVNIRIQLVITLCTCTDTLCMYYSPRKTSYSWRLPFSFCPFFQPLPLQLQRPWERQHGTNPPDGKFHNIVHMWTSFKTACNQKWCGSEIWF